MPGGGGRTEEGVTFHDFQDIRLAVRIKDHEKHLLPVKSAAGP